MSNEITTLATETIAQNTNETTEKKTKWSLSKEMSDILDYIASFLSNKEAKKLQKLIIDLRALGVTTKDVEEKLADCKGRTEPTDADYIFVGKALWERYTAKLVTDEAKLAEKANEKKAAK